MSSDPRLVLVAFLTISTGISNSKSEIALTSRALSSISGQPDSAQSDAAQISTVPAELPAVLKSLLLSFRHSTTSLALAFKAPLTVAAALQQLDKFTKELCQASSCVLAAAAQGPSGTMLDEWRDGVLDICTEAVRFLDVLADSTTANGSSSGGGSGENPYLHHTGLVWDRVDSLTSDLSASEGEAVVRRWKMDTAVVKDAWSEFKESIDSMEVLPARDAGSADKRPETEGADEWDEDDMMGLGSDTITEDEKRTVDSVCYSLVVG
jgi:hypothetical protein